MAKGKITIEVSDEFYAEMKKQKRTILVLLASKLIPKEKVEELEGTLNFFDHIQDKGIKKRTNKLIFDKNQILDLPPDKDEDPEGYKAHTDAFNKEVKDLDDEIVSKYKQTRY